MADLVERLRAPAYWYSESSEGHPGDNDALIREAASEIERLREVLDNLRISAARVANKYGRDPKTDQLLDWEEWKAVRRDCDEASLALSAYIMKEVGDGD